jgi:hypothetical protein
MRKDEEVVELAGWRLEQLANDLGMLHQTEKHGPWVTMRLTKHDGTVYLEVKERGYLNAVKAIEAAQDEIEKA